MNIDTITNDELQRHFIATTANEVNLIDRVDHLTKAQKRIESKFEDLEVISADNVDSSFDQCVDLAIEKGVITNIDKFLEVFKPYLEVFKTLEKNISDQDDQIEALESAIDHDTTKAY
jgi:chaperonin cofactor prefoldin